MNRITRRSLALLAAAALPSLLLTGCDTVKAPASSQPDQLPAAAYPQIVVDRELQGLIVNGVPKVEHARIMSVVVPIRAITDRADLRAEYRFIFLNKSGVPIPDEPKGPDWRWIQLPSRSQVFLSGNAIDAGGEDWRLEIRPAR